MLSAHNYNKAWRAFKIMSINNFFMQWVIKSFYREKKLPLLKAITCKKKKHSIVYSISTGHMML